METGPIFTPWSPSDALWAGETFEFCDVPQPPLESPTCLCALESPVNDTGNSTEAEGGFDPMVYAEKAFQYAKVAARYTAVGGANAYHYGGE